MEIYFFDSFVFGKVIGGFVELELGNWKIVVGFSGRRNCLNMSESVIVGVFLGGFCLFF